MRPLFHVILHEPEIPNNTGNIGRTCMALGCALHLVRPLGFDTSIHALRRAGLDYWPRLAPAEHDSWEEAVRSAGAIGRASAGDPGGPPGPGGRVWLYSTKGTRPHWEADLRPGDALAFGKETRGLPPELLERYADRVVTIPMVEGERSLNLATVVCAALAEGVRQCVTRGEVRVTKDGRLEGSGVGRVLEG